MLEESQGMMLVSTEDKLKVASVLGCLFEDQNQVEPANHLSSQSSKRQSRSKYQFPTPTPTPHLILSKLSKDYPKGSLPIFASHLPKLAAIPNSKSLPSRPFYSLPRSFSCSNKNNLLKIINFFISIFPNNNFILNCIFHSFVILQKMLRTKDGPGSLATQKQSESHQSKRKIEQQQKKKPLLLRELENELKHLDELDDEDFKENQDPYVTDPTLDRLQMIAKQASKLDIKEIEKLCRLAIGKRILNIELKKKKDEHNSKLLKKEKIELFFRENRIKRYDYDTLVDEKLQESTLIVKAYDNGKGFIESDRMYKEKYERALIECNFMGTVKEVNKIFYDNYTGVFMTRTPTQMLLKFIWIPILLFLCLGITLPFISFLYEQLVLMVLLSLILLALFFASVKTFRDKPNQNNQIEQSISDVKAYFEQVNLRFEKRGAKIEWNCSKDFMYLQVIFHNGFPL